MYTRATYGNSTGAFSKARVSGYVTISRRYAFSPPRSRGIVIRVSPRRRACDIKYLACPAFSGQDSRWHRFSVFSCFSVRDTGETRTRFVFTEGGGERGGTFFIRLFAVDE